MVDTFYLSEARTYLSTLMSDLTENPNNVYVIKNRYNRIHDCVLISRERYAELKLLEEQINGEH